VAVQAVAVRPHRLKNPVVVAMKAAVVVAAWAA
jgi:hypothetical protein